MHPARHQRLAKGNIAREIRYPLRQPTDQGPHEPPLRSVIFHYANKFRLPVSFLTLLMISYQ
jgi:hypothetical protein